MVQSHQIYRNRLRAWLSHIQSKFWIMRLLKYLWQIYCHPHLILTFFSRSTRIHTYAPTNKRPLQIHTQQNYRFEWEILFLFVWDRPFFLADCFSCFNFFHCHPRGTWWYTKNPACMPSTMFALSPVGTREKKQHFQAAESRVLWHFSSD